jgi:hypothetical protein
MRTIVAFIASAVLNWTMIAAVASECTSTKDIAVARSRWTALRSQPVGAADKENVCRAYATSFYESVTLRQLTANCVDHEWALATLDSEINTFNDLLAARCGG